MINFLKAETSPISPWSRSAIVFACVTLALAACQPSTDQEKSKLINHRSVTAQDAQASSSGLSELALLGKKLFFDPALSGSGKMSCATCHDPANAYGPPNNLAVQLGGADLKTQGLRAVPSLRYVLNRTPFWSKQFVSNPVERLIETDSPPVGGLTWDGRFNTLHEQASAPLLAANEMANESPNSVISKVAKSAYATDFAHAFGQNVWQDPARAFNGLLLAIERFELEDASFHPYTSKFDQTLKGQATLSASELKGLQLFSAPDKGNCASCHLAVSGADHSAPLFTDFSFSALGAPRNPQIIANRNRQFYDLGLCGPSRIDQQKKHEYCGMFKTPGLRNVANRRVFMHNGVFNDLESVVRFYVERDTKPEKWYPKNSDGSVNKFNDLPVNLRSNVDTLDVPLNRKKSDSPALSDEEIKDVVAFLKTLSDQ
ncbi:cytochrome-c peroxidase [Solimicrobium silvestre]|uniref:Cytochrome c peroxidase n=1 Tax=Solimicrobium silvestre TaxID=2099400 RepID=A0A2S9GXP8_9BURK|nr:cytochrome c peroxidase [Solimicrobium silvestre]PRC92489.1 Cytochrome c peroxidase [Solimicrobium silvestre]